MYNLSDINTISGILSRYGFSFSKSLGQNFIIDESVCPQMAECAIPHPDCGVIEIGPGIGVLTVELSKRAKKVVSIELDKRLLPILDETLKDCDNVKVINADIMEIDLKSVIEEEFPGMDVVICANLPYYITSPVIMLLLEQQLGVLSITVMVQAEAADRLCAAVGTRNSGAVTIAVNMYADSEDLFFVPRDSFLPAPKVDSKVIRLAVRDSAKYAPADIKAFFGMVKSAFTMRRKTILNSLPGSLHTDKAHLLPVLDELGISPTARIEQLTMDELVSVFNAFYN